MTVTESSHPGSRDGMPWIDAALGLLAFVLAHLARYELEIVRPVLKSIRPALSLICCIVPSWVAWLALQYRGSGLYKHTRTSVYG